MVVYKDKTKLLYRLTHGSFQVFLYDFFFSFVYFILYIKKNSAIKITSPFGLWKNGLYSGGGLTIELRLRRN